MVWRNSQPQQTRRHRRDHAGGLSGNTLMTVEFLPFTRPTLDEATIASVVDVMRSGWLTSGPKVKALEAALSEYCGGRPVRVANSGTATLEVGLIIAGVKAGDEVITTPMSWAATSNVIVRLGVKPVF